MLGAAGVPPKGSAPPGRARPLGHPIVLAGFHMAQDRTFGSDPVRTAGSSGTPNRCGFPQDRLRITAKGVREKKMQALRATAAAPRAASRPRLARASASSARVRRCGHRNWNVELVAGRFASMRSPRERDCHRAFESRGDIGAFSSAGSAPTNCNPSRLPRRRSLDRLLSYPGLTSTRVPPTSAFALSTLPPRPCA